MKIKDVELNIVCGYTSALPQTEEIQVAFAGKSNVGKSSSGQSRGDARKNQNNQFLSCESHVQGDGC